MKVGAIGYSCASGLGHLNKWFYENHVVDEVFVINHPEYVSHPEWFPEAPSTPLRGMDLSRIMAWSKGFDVILCYETPFSWALPSWWRHEAKIKTACLVMHEWYPTDRFGAFDLYLCPSLLDYDIFRPENTRTESSAVQVTVPVDPATWRRRSTVRRFLHNAGHVGHREHKGTRQLLEAMRHVTKPIDITIRGQGREFVRLLQEFAGFSGTWDRAGGQMRITTDVDDVPYDQLFPPEFDAYVAPERLNGLSLPLQEARAAGMLVVTTDRYPTNTWLPKEPLIPVDGYHKARVSARCVEIDEAEINPEVIARVLDRWHGADVEEYSLSGKRWAEENSWERWTPIYRKLLHDLCNS